MRSLVICGPSGVGKGTLINRLLEKFSGKYALAVSHTTRQPRRGEINGVHYHFVTPDAMKKGIASELFVEHAQVHANMYGTSLEAVDRIHKSGRICVLDVDTKGVQQLKSCQFPARYVFILPPSLEALESRLRSRGTESEEQLKIRLENAKTEIAYGTAPDVFDQVLVNDDCDECFGNLQIHVTEWFPEGDCK
jgi:guanylate kinase